MYSESKHREEAKHEVSISPLRAYSSVLDASRIDVGRVDLLLRTKQLRGLYSNKTIPTSYCQYLNS